MSLRGHEFASIKATLKLISRVTCTIIRSVIFKKCRQPAREGEEKKKKKKKKEKRKEAEEGRYIITRTGLRLSSVDFAGGTRWLFLYLPSV